MSKYTKTFSNGQPLDAADLNAMASAQNDTYEYARGSIGTAEQSAEEAKRAASKAEGYLAELKTAINALPSGQAVSAQVASNTAKLAQHDNALNEQQQAIEDIEDEMEYMANSGGYYQPMRVGSCDALADTGENVEYREFIGGRMVNNAPEQQGSRVPNSTSAVTDIYLKKVWGDVVGGNQIVNLATFSNSTISGVKFTVNDGIITANGTATASIIFASSQEMPKDKKVIVIGCPNGGSSSTYRLTSRYLEDFADYGSGNIYKYTGSYSPGSICIKINEGTVCDNLKFVPSIVNLETLFPTDTAFVNSLGADDASKVLHRLGFYSYTINSSSLAVTHNNDDLLQLGAEVIAKMGYQEPKMTLSNVGRINLISGKTGAKKYSVDMRLHLRKAWEKVLERIEERGIAIPDILKEPRLCKINDNVGIFLRPDGIEVSAWGVEFDGTEEFLQYQVHEFFAKNLLKDAVKNTIGSAVATAVRIKMFVGVSDLNNRGDMSGAIYCQSGPEGHYWGSVSIRNDAINDVAGMNKWLADLKAAGTPLIVVYELATPIFIPFEELGLGKLALSFVDVMPYDIWTLDDMDGNPMYKVESAENASRVITSRIYPNPEWVESNKQLPVAIDTVLSGFKTSANYALIMDMLRRINNAGL